MTILAVIARMHGLLHFYRCGGCSVIVRFDWKSVEFATSTVPKNAHRKQWSELALPLVTVHTNFVIQDIVLIKDLKK